MAKRDEIVKVLHYLLLIVLFYRQQERVAGPLQIYPCEGASLVDWWGGQVESLHPAQAQQLLQLKKICYTIKEDSLQASIMMSTSSNITQDIQEYNEYYRGGMFVIPSTRCAKADESYVAGTNTLSSDLEATFSEPFASLAINPLAPACANAFPDSAPVPRIAPVRQITNEVVNGCFDSSSSGGLSLSKLVDQPWLYIVPFGYLQFSLYINCWSQADQLSAWPPEFQVLTAEHDFLTYFPSQSGIPGGKELTIWIESSKGVEEMTLIPPKGLIIPIGLLKFLPFSALILPCHLAHRRSHDFNAQSIRIAINKIIVDPLTNIYFPRLRKHIRGYVLEVLPVAVGFTGCSQGEDNEKGVDLSKFGLEIYRSEREYMVDAILTLLDDAMFLVLRRGISDILLITPSEFLVDTHVHASANLYPAMSSSVVAPPASRDYDWFIYPVCFGKYKRSPNWLTNTDWLGV
ncbi:uncharacterized protein BDR25DRAFT_360566 [Lindgomyces ingoldianus]|uniref:Uncharacterized protein n=1 Tax=Lindgomyces ingoldianus TaxID=673940 RepID=A0ACB6QFH9_9PLEO|nr:uncharacterized protein BDR25DRAFT_360566 [Lindgomyces ingoldianus]KAF2465630.1 hypothetical protein BDR25DRAFT_360566 [Lindgomyces ingoldianus]